MLYSPLQDRARTVMGTLLVAREPPRLGTPEERLRTLTELLMHAAGATRSEQACARAIETLARHPADLLFACISVCEPDGRWRRLCGTLGTPADAETRLPLAEAVNAGRPLIAENGSALVVPLRAPGEGTALRGLVVALAPGRVVDQQSLRFFAQVGQVIACALAIAHINTQAEKHAQIVSLQDHALQAFFVIGLVARTALTELAQDQTSSGLAPVLAQIIDVATGGREHLREAVLALGHADVSQSGVVEALQSLARTFQARTAIDAELLVQGTPRGLSTEASQALHQAATEALANIERDSRAGAVVLSLRFTRLSVTLSIQDDSDVVGSGPAAERPSRTATSVRLRGVGDRVRSLGGTFVARPAREGGFLVRIRLPLTNDDT